jgi:hypothetical protein
MSLMTLSRERKGVADRPCGGAVSACRRVSVCFIYLDGRKVQGGFQRNTNSHGSGSFAAFDAQPSQLISDFRFMRSGKLACKFYPFASRAVRLAVKTQR